MITNWEEHNTNCALFGVPRLVISVNKQKPAKRRLYGWLIFLTLLTFAEKADSFFKFEIFIPFFLTNNYYLQEPHLIILGNPLTPTMDDTQKA